MQYADLYSINLDNFIDYIYAEARIIVFVFLVIALNQIKLLSAHKRRLRPLSMGFFNLAII